MDARRQNLCLAWAALHLALIGLVCAHETLWLLGKSVTIAPASMAPAWEAIDRFPAALLGEANRTGVWRRVISTYTNAAGIEVGYGYFAPNVPLTHALVFECRHADGRVDYQTPQVQSEAAHLRLTTLIEQIGRTDYEKWREELIKLLARSTWQRSSDVVSVRAFFGSVAPPTLAEYRAGRRERTFTCDYVYDFGPAETKAAPSAP